MQNLKLIEASAGCGKTTFLLKEYSNNPNGSLFITFSNTASNELINRIKNKEAKIMTLHSLAHKILTQNNSKLTIIENTLENEAISLLLKKEEFRELFLWLLENSDGKIEEKEIEEIKIIKETPLIKHEEFDILFDIKLIPKKTLDKIKSIFFTKENNLRKKIKLEEIKLENELKHEYINQVINRINLHKKIFQNHTFLIKNKIFLAKKETEKHLKKTNNVLYYDDLIIDSIELIKEKELKISEFLGNIHTLYIDESQDLSKTQWEFIITILKINSDIKNVYISGDSKQLIYEFQGSNIDIFNFYKNELKKMASFFEEIHLNNTYRICENICKFINKIGSNFQNIDFKEHISKNNKKNGEIQILKCSSFDEIISLIDYDSMLLFKQKTEKFENFAKILIKNGKFLNSPYIILHPIFKDFQYLLKWLIYKDPLALGVISNLFGYSNIKHNELINIDEIIQLKKLNYENLITLFFQWISLTKVNDFYTKKLNKAKDFYLNLLFEYSKYYKYEPYKAIFDLNNFYKNNSKLFEQGIFFNTIHSSKGKEADSVFLFDTDIKTKFEIESDRLFYVAISRVRYNLIIPIFKKEYSETWFELIEKTLII